MTCLVFERGSFWTKSPPWIGASPFQREMERIQIPPPPNKKNCEGNDIIPQPTGKTKQILSPDLRNLRNWGRKKGGKRERPREKERSRDGKERFAVAALRSVGLRSTPSSKGLLAVPLPLEPYHFLTKPSTASRMVTLYTHTHHSTMECCTCQPWFK